MSPITTGTPSGRPYVVVHVAVSLDGSTTGFQPNIGLFYELAARWDEDVTLTGADTILAQEEALANAPRPGPAEDGPLLIVVDGQGRVRGWDALREAGHWSDVLALHAEKTPPRPPGRAVRELVIGRERVDLNAALTSINDLGGVNVVRVDSGGALTGALLQGSLIDEVSLLVHPLLAGSEERKPWYGTQSLTTKRLERIASQTFDDGIVWLRYRLRK
ncbi:RibD family protein [Actinomadura rudentiformis]|uniref:RibD family protein n=2 Tax=Actinomadura rudentiformis TaxID=359158 RepID=A0A6H9Z0N5_9ACTN|nr:RibD family protein [Actinomadura rudentiformis]